MQVRTALIANATVLPFSEPRLITLVVGGLDAPQSALSALSVLPIRHLAVVRCCRGSCPCIAQLVTTSPHLHFHRFDKVCLLQFGQCTLRQYGCLAILSCLCFASCSQPHFGHSIYRSAKTYSSWVPFCRSCSWWNSFSISCSTCSS